MTKKDRRANYEKASRWLVSAALLGLISLFAGIAWHSDPLTTYGFLITVLAGLAAGITSLTSKNILADEANTEHPSKGVPKNPYLMAFMVMLVLFIGSFVKEIAKEYPLAGFLILAASGGAFLLLRKKHRKS